MSTIYILAGGADAKNPSYWENLRSAVLITRPLKILSCQFAQPESEWQERLDNFKPFFQEAFGKDITVALASVNKFSTQVQEAGLVYLHGGDTKKLRRLLDDVEDIESLFKDKVVIGSSAGAQFLSRWFWSCGTRKTSQGKSIVPLDVVVHYGSDYGSDTPLGPIDWEDAKSTLRQAAQGNGLVLLPEGQFIVYEK